MIRRPKYLDTDLVRDLLDYLGLEVPESADIVRRQSSDRQKRLGIARGLEAGVGSTKGAEESEAYTRAVRGTQLLDLVIDEFARAGELIQLDENPEAELRHRAPIEVGGELTVSPASEIAEILGLMLPLVGQMPELMEKENPEVPPSVILEAFLGHGSPSAPTVMTLQPEDGPFRFVMVLRPQYALVDSVTDLEGEMTVFGVTERVLAEQQSISLERYLFPGQMNRALRRAMGQKDVEELLDSMATVTDKKLKLEDLRFEGPGALLGVGAIYP